MGWPTIRRCAAGGASVLVGFAGEGLAEKSVQARAIRAAVAACRRIKFFGGAEAPEQLLPYLERRHAISDHAGSVYRSVNARVGASGSVFGSSKLSKLEDGFSSANERTPGKNCNQMKLSLEEDECVEFFR